MNTTAQWDMVLQGKLVEGVWGMYNVTTNFWLPFILFLVLQFMLVVKTKNWTLVAVSGMLYSALFLTGRILIKPLAANWIGYFILMEIDGIIYAALSKWKK